MSATRSMATRIFVLGLGALASCGGGPSLADGLGASAASVSTASTEGPSFCRGTDMGCLCASEGRTVSCPGPTIHDGSYVTCPAGERTCTGGHWGACISRYTYQAAGNFSEDYRSECGETAATRWVAVTLLEDLPAGAEVSIDVQTADSASLLDEAPVAPLAALRGAVSHRSETFDVQAALDVVGMPSRAWLRVKVTVHPGLAAAAGSSVVISQPKSECGAP